MYIVVSIGNSDDKLSQVEWCRFTRDINYEIEQLGKIRFHGAPPNYQAWQNVAWIAEIEPGRVDSMVRQITKVREKYKQDSAFVMVGVGMFV